MIGVGEGESFVASDVPGILQHTRNIYFLADGDMAILTLAGVELTDFDGKPIKREITRIQWDPIQAEKGGYKHFMLKEIWEQPRAVRDTTLGRVSLDSGKVYLGEMKLSDKELAEAASINIAACGTSWHAALTGKYMIERLARLPVDVDYASEYRYRNPIPDAKALGLLITQSRIAAQRAQDPRHRQRRRLDHRPRSRWRDLYARGAGNRRGFNEGIHRAAYRAVFAGAETGPTARTTRSGTVGGADWGVEPRSRQD